MARYKLTIVRNTWYEVTVEAGSEEAAEKLALSEDVKWGDSVDKDESVEEVECLDEEDEE